MITLARKTIAWNNKDTVLIGFKLNTGTVWDSGDPKTLVVIGSYTVEDIAKATKLSVAQITVEHISDPADPKCPEWAKKWV
jgi:hypothetical protein